MTTAQIQLPPKLIPVFLGEARYRGAYGGRGSGKTRSFAKMTAVRGYQWSMAGESGVIVCGREFMNSLDESSMAEVKAAILEEPWLAAHYEIGEKFIRTKDRRIEYAFIGLRHSLDSIKSKARIKLLWVDEAEPVSETAWEKTIPTVREHDSEVWLTWNPERKQSATHKRFRQDPPPNSKIVELNYKDNPWFPEVLEQERMEDLRKRPDSYAHVWEGDFKTAMSGSYYGRLLIEAKDEGRISAVARDPLLTLRAHIDIGGTGARADAFSLIIDQFVGQQVRVVDYYEAVGQPLATHADWLRSKGYTPERTTIVLPHDGASHDKVFNVSYESAFRDMGYTVVVIPNMGSGAAVRRIEAARRMFPSVWFNEATTSGLRDALGWYHEKRDDKRDIGLGPNHDWSSHAADAFGLLAVDHAEYAPSKPIELNFQTPFHHSGVPSLRMEW